MPMYDFKCDNKDCGVYFERIVPYGTEEENCPKCQGSATRVLLAPGQRPNIKFFFNYMEP